MLVGQRFGLRSEAAFLEVSKTNLSSINKLSLRWVMLNPFEVRRKGQEQSGLLRFQRNTRKWTLRRCLIVNDLFSTPPYQSFPPTSSHIGKDNFGRQFHLLSLHNRGRPKDFIDVTLVYEDSKQVQAHKVVLDMCGHTVEAGPPHGRPPEPLSRIISSWIDGFVSFWFCRWASNIWCLEGGPIQRPRIET